MTNLNIIQIILTVTVKQFIGVPTNKRRFKDSLPSTYQPSNSMMPFRGIKKTQKKKSLSK